MISVNGRLMVREGTDEPWRTDADLAIQIRYRLKKEEAGYVVELAIPWQLVGGKPLDTTEVRYVPGLLYDNDGGAIDASESSGEGIGSEGVEWYRLRLSPGK